MRRILIVIALFIGLGIITTTRTDTNRPRATTNTTATSRPAPLPTTVASASQTCVTAVHDANAMFENADQLVTDTARLFTAIADGNYDVDSQLDTIANTTGDAISAVQTATGSIQDCLDSSPPVACQKVAKNASDAAALYATVFSAINDGMQALANADSAGLENAAAEIAYETDPLAAARAQYELAATACIRGNA